MPSFLLASMLLALALSGCSGLSGEPAIIATVAPTRATESPLPLSRGWQPDIANGARIFAERCVECHGASGDGLGDLALAGNIERPPDMTDRQSVLAKSPLAWFEIISKGRIKNLMPPWENALSEAQRWDVTLYSYTLAYDDALLTLGERLWRDRCGACEQPANVPPIYSDVEYAAKLNRELFEAALTDAEAAAAAAYARLRTLKPEAASAGTESNAPGDLRGRVLHGTAGGLVPAETVVQLRYGNDDIAYRVAETAIDSRGAFQFQDIPLAADLNYAIGAVYDGRLFSQRYAPGQDEAGIITIYDATHDPRVVSLARIDLYIEPLTLGDLGAGLYITQMLRYRNRSDRIYTSGRGFDDGREASLLIQLPAGAKLLSGDAQGRYVLIENLEPLPDSAIDTLPVMPGESHTVLLEYWLPYADAADFAQAFNNLIEAEVTVSLSDNLHVESDWLQPHEAADLGTGIRQYRASLSLERDPQVSFGISGKPSSHDALVITSETLPALLLGVILLAAATIGAISRRRKDGRNGNIDSLVAELARLEADHEQGRINHDLYHQRRRALKAKLAQRIEAAHE